MAFRSIGTLASEVLRDVKAAAEQGSASEALHPAARHGNKATGCAEGDTRTRSMRSTEEGAGAQSGMGKGTGSRKASRRVGSQQEEVTEDRSREERPRSNQAHMRLVSPTMGKRMKVARKSDAPRSAAFIRLVTVDGMLVGHY